MDDSLFSLTLGFPLGRINPERLRERYKSLVPGRTIEVSITGSLGDELAIILKKELLKQTIKRLQQELDSL
jgi:hypothetical protein